ncbi:hypothetical protein A7X81_00950 [Campylobacter ornithocola]|uniref:Uncharacterized protein n=1 Tax=Campylobacter ornithocola TaxID=1848766 RepID=A0A6M8N7J6_9BACT|nr:hypothetical protein [Campylobacter ornithocola]OCX43557.1 hypothetical protein A7X81_00950 [Campylobacter ornithocola]QKF57893.1 acyl carrier protein [Campylobacter ornithocola]
MTRKEFLNKLEDALQLDYELSEDTLLENIEEYDSLGLLSITTLYSVLFDIYVQGKTLLECKSVADLIDLIPIDKLED